METIHKGDTMRYNIGALVQYCRLPHANVLYPTIDPHIGVVTDVDEFGDYRVVWTSGGVGWYTSAEIEPFERAVKK